MTRLLLLRHGQTHSNVSGALDTGEPGHDLTDLGRAQAVAAVRALEQHDLTGLHVSRLVRTHQTAHPLATARALDPSIVHGLEEIRAGEFEMRNDHDAVAGYLGSVAAWITGDLDPRMPGGETGHEFLQRYDAGIEQIVRDAWDRPTRTVLLVSHGAAIRTWVSRRVEGAEDHPEAQERLENTGLITVEGDPASGWKLLDWHSAPIGGRFLEDEEAPDPTAVPVED